MGMRHAAVVAGLALGLTSGSAKASYIFNAQQVGNNVVITGSGRLDLAGLSYSGDNSYSAEIDDAPQLLKIGIGVSDAYSGLFVQQNPFIFAGYRAKAQESIGVSVGFDIVDSDVLVPQGYVSGSVIPFSSSIFPGYTFANLGLGVGSYTFDLPSDTIQLNIGVSPVPLPSSAPMFGAALLGLAGLGYAAKRKAKTTA